MCKNMINVTEQAEKLYPLKENAECFTAFIQGAKYALNHLYKEEYILCSAIKRIEPKGTQMYYENDLHLIEIGYRHCDIFAYYPGLVSRSPCDQGFYTSKGRFVDRKIAMKIALKCGQVLEENLHNPLIGLFSEDLY